MRVIQNASVDPVAAAGSVWSSVADMAKWMRFMLDSGHVDGKALLEPETFAELLEPQTAVPTGQFYPTARLTRPHWMANLDHAELRHALVLSRDRPVRRRIH